MTSSYFRLNLIISLQYYIVFDGSVEIVSEVNKRARPNLAASVPISYTYCEDAQPKDGGNAQLEPFLAAMLPGTQGLL